MALKYIYSLVRETVAGRWEILNSTTQKWSLQNWMSKNVVEAGFSLSPLTVVRMKDGMPDTVSYIDPYEFMEIDLGEE